MISFIKGFSRQKPDQETLDQILVQSRKRNEMLEQGVHSHCSVRMNRLLYGLCVISMNNFSSKIIACFTCFKKLATVCRLVIRSAFTRYANATLYFVAT